MRNVARIVTASLALTAVLLAGCEYDVQVDFELGPGQSTGMRTYRFVIDPTAGDVEVLVRNGDPLYVVLHVFEVRADLDTGTVDVDYIIFVDEDAITDTTYESAMVLTYSLPTIEQRQAKRADFTVRVE